jgi:hypothetical protein
MLLFADVIKLRILAEIVWIILNLITNVLIMIGQREI